MRINTAFFSLRCINKVSAYTVVDISCEGGQLVTDHLHYMNINMFRFISKDIGSGKAKIGTRHPHK